MSKLIDLPTEPTSDQPLLLIPFDTIGQLRHAIEGIPNDVSISAQVAALDGSAWNMEVAFCPQLKAGGTCIVMMHKDLKTLNND